MKLKTLYSVIVTLVLSFLSPNEGFSFASTKHSFRKLKYRGIMEALAAEPGSQSIKYGGVHHCGVLVSDLEKSKQFYMDVFGFSDESHLRPKTLPYGGAFLGVGANQIHLMQLPNPGSPIIDSLCIQHIFY
jgi:hypothetical protein